MKSMRVIYDDTEGLTNLINEVYFGDNNGKIPEKFEQKLKLETSVLKTILSDLQGCDIKVENEIVDGSMKFKTEEDGDDLYLIPTSIYCVKKDGDKEFYSFY